MENETIISPSFKAWLLGSRQHRIILWLIAIALVVQWGIFKYLYPYANFIHGDSFVYIQTAYDNLDINTYLAGYSRLLRLFSVFSKSDLALTSFQYLLVQGSSLFLLATIFYFYQPNKWVQLVLLSFMVLNPLFLHMANLVSSDVYFLALSLVWFALLLWIIHRPFKGLILWHTAILFIAFTVRYNALIYPFIAVLAFWMAPLPLRKKWIGITAPVLLVGLFVLNTGFKYKKLTGQWQYSPFSGWQMANNAMYAYRYVDSADRKPVPPRFKQLDNMIRTYFDTTRDVKKNPIEAMQASTVYMWTRHLTLYKYRELHFTKDTTASELKRWAMMGPFYKDYGNFIIKQYPWHFARYFMWPNTIKYYAPPIEFLNVYNSGVDSVTEVARVWFEYPKRKLKIRTSTPTVYILEFYPILTGIINVVMLLSLICFALLDGFRQNTLFRKGMLLAATVWLLNAAFSIFASSIALRFQAFPILLTTLFTIVLLNRIWKMGIEEVKLEKQVAAGSLA